MNDDVSIPRGEASPEGDADESISAPPENHVGHASGDIAYHVEWGFSREAAVWEAGMPVVLNFFPVATNLHEWLLRKTNLGVLTEQDKSDARAISNPYAYHSSALALVLSIAVNDAHAFAASTAPIDPLKAEGQRVRFFGELALLSVRVCEAIIKQLLHCTQIPRSYYKRASLGGLLSTECRGCKASGNKRHKISLLGSLAHRYHLCHPFEQCLVDHLRLALIQA